MANRMLFRTISVVSSYLLELCYVGQCGTLQDCLQSCVLYACMHNVHIYRIYMPCIWLHVFYRQSSIKYEPGRTEYLFDPRHETYSGVFIRVCFKRCGSSGHLVVTESILRYPKIKRLSEWLKALNVTDYPQSQVGFGPNFLSAQDRMSWPFKSVVHFHKIIVLHGQPSSFSIVN